MSWVDDFAKVVNTASGAIQTTAAALNPPKLTTVASPTPPEGETAPTQKPVAVANDTAAKATFPIWAVALIAVAIFALVES